MDTRVLHDRTGRAAALSLYNQRYLQQAGPIETTTSLLTLKEATDKQQ